MEASRSDVQYSALLAKRQAHIAAEQKYERQAVISWVKAERQSIIDTARAKMLSEPRKVRHGCAWQLHMSLIVYGNHLLRHGLEPILPLELLDAIDYARPPVTLREVNEHIRRHYGFFPTWMPSPVHPRAIVTQLPHVAQPDWRSPPWNAVFYYPDE